MLANASKESEGSTKLFALWKQVGQNEAVEKGVLVHARDESRHAQLFVELSGRAFPMMFRPSDLERFRASLPDVRRSSPVKSEKSIGEPELIDHLVQMNIGEIRTRIHVHLLAPVISVMAPESERDRVRTTLTCLERDEVRHIGYTAKLMENWARGGDAKLVRGLYKRRLHEFNIITLRESEAAVRSYGQGRFPELLEI